MLIYWELLTNKTVDLESQYIYILFKEDAKENALAMTAWTSNYIHDNVSDEITYSFPTFNSVIRIQIQ